MYFQTINKDILHIGNVVQALVRFVELSPYHEYDLLIGTDSNFRKKVLCTVSVIFLWNLNTRKFRFFYDKQIEKIKGRLEVSQKIIREASRSLEIADYLKHSEVMSLLSDNCMEIHLDVGYHGKSVDVLPACKGMVTGSGYRCQVKPDAWTASHLADRFTKI
jgi:predicted RNase H-related nuclease YkuK (DUF458 family)